MARSDLLWLDSDILLDWLCARQPWVQAATELIERAVSGEWKIVYSPLTLANIFYPKFLNGGMTDRSTVKPVDEWQEKSGNYRMDHPERSRWAADGSSPSHWPPSLRRRIRVSNSAQHCPGVHRAVMVPAWCR